METPGLGDPVFLIPCVFHLIFRPLGAIFWQRCREDGLPFKGPSQPYWVLTLSTICFSVFLESIFKEILEFSEGWEKWKNPRQMNFPLLLFISCVHPETHLGGFIAATEFANCKTHKWKQSMNEEVDNMDK